MHGVTLMPSKKILPDGTVQKQLGVVPEAVIGTIVYAGVTYLVIRGVDAAITNAQKVKP